MSPRSRFYHRPPGEHPERSVAVLSLGIHERMPPGLIAHGGPGAPFLLMHFHDPAELELDGRLVDATGRFVLWDAGSRHRYGHPGASWDHSWMNLRGSAVAEAAAREALPLGRPLDGVPPAVSERYLGLLLDELRGRHPPDAPVLAGLVALYLREVALAWRGPGEEPAEQRRLLAARRLIEEGLDRPLRLEDLAAEAGLSVSQFSLLFRRRFGTSPMRYLDGLRMQAARRLLEQSALSVQAVAERVGFEDPLYFSRRFKRHLGSSPSAYRVRARG